MHIIQLLYNDSPTSLEITQGDPSWKITDHHWVPGPRQEFWQHGEVRRAPFSEAHPPLRNMAWNNSEAALQCSIGSFCHRPSGLRPTPSGHQQTEQNLKAQARFTVWLTDKTDLGKEIWAAKQENWVKLTLLTTVRENTDLGKLT